MTAEETIEEKLEKLAQTIGCDDSLVGNVMGRIDAKSISESHRIIKLKKDLIIKTVITHCFTKLVAAVVVIIAVGISIYYITGGATTRVYGITDVPELFKKASVIHTQGRKYFPRDKLPDGQEIPPVEMEQWIDLENTRVRFTAVGLSSGLNDVKISVGEAISDGEYKMHLSHTDKYAIFFKISNYQGMLEKHHTLSHMFGQMFGDTDRLGNFTKMGQDEINGVEYVVWEGQVIHSVTKQAERYKYWLSPSTGESGRVEAWAKPQGGQWRLDYEYYLIERDVEIPQGIFATEAPEGYALKNTKETAIPLELDDGGSVHCGSLTLDSRINFTLSNGSVILGWCSVNRESETSQVELFEDLEFGGALPKLPVEIWGLKAGSWTGDITYVGRHLVYTQKGEMFIEWSLYVPESMPPARSEMLGYDVLYRFNLEEKPKWRIGYTLEYGIRIETEEDFNKWVLGAMAELSDDGKAPDGITYESVLQLSEWSQKVID